MKIDGLPPILVPLPSSVLEKKKVATKSKASAAGTNPKGEAGASESIEDKVEVGDHQETLKVIRDLVAAQPDIRMGEVDRITRQLRSKKYKINFEKVAEGFIKEAILTEIARKPRKK